MSNSPFLVVSATGNQGSNVTRKLLANGHRVHALTRNPESESSSELRSAGATLFKGTFADIDSVERAAKGCEAMFLVLLPNSTELEDGRNVIKAARASGISKCVYSSVTNCDKIVQRTEFSRDIFRADYFLNKVQIQDLVKSEFSSWTILQPGMFMTNIIDPMGRFFFPKLGTEHILHGAWKPDTKIFWIDPSDIATFAVTAFETDRLDQKQIPLAGSDLTIPELASLISEISGKRIEAEYIGDEAVSALKDNTPLVSSAEDTNKGWFDVDMDSVKSFGIELTTMKQFLVAQRELGTLGPI